MSLILRARRLAAIVLGLASLPAVGQTLTCRPGRAESALDVNRVFAASFNTGALFFGGTKTNGEGYLVPRASNRSPIYAAGLWVGGTVAGEVRVAAARYSNFNFWPGPLDAATGKPATLDDCAVYDRIYRVSNVQIANYVRGAGDIGDVVDWPFQLGAPVVDGDGNPGNYNPGGGDRPDIVGDQALWWVMNDVGPGGLHPSTNTRPLGVEVRVLAYAFNRVDALGDATFYRYTLVNKGGADITNAYLSVFVDADLGNPEDDYVGSDRSLGLGYAYNADNDDQGAIGYGIAPPAIGVDVLRGPVVSDGPDAGSDPDTLGLTAFSYFINNTDASTTGDPSLGTQIYRYMQGLWGDGSQMRAFGNGYKQSQGDVTAFAFSGDPVTGQSWSEVNNGTSAPRNSLGDRRFVVHTGPFRFKNGDTQDALFGVLFARGSSNLNSVTALRAASRLAQSFYKAGGSTPVATGDGPEGGAGTGLGVPSPNPFTTEARVPVGASEGPVRADLFDVLGRHVALVHDGPLTGDLRVSGAELVPGVYVLRVRTSAGEQSVRLVRK